MNALTAHARTCHCRIAYALLACTFALARVAFATAPPNDNFADRILITGESGSVSGANISASLEPGEPNDGNDSTVWWSWSPPGYDVYTIDTFGSSYNTFLDVLYGDALTTLFTEAENDDAQGTPQSAVCIEGGPSDVYHIQVSGSAPCHEGSIVLNWQKATGWSDWVLSRRYTDTFFVVALAPDLSILTLWTLEAWQEFIRTNALGCEERRYESKYCYTNGFTIIDKDGGRRVDDKMPEGIGPHFSFGDYDGTRVLLVDPDNESVLAYTIRKGGFVKSGERQVDDCVSAWFEGSEVHVFLNDAQGEGLMVLSRNLKKQKWVLPPAPGDIFTLGRRLVAHIVRDNGTVNIDCLRKGQKLVSQHSITTTPAHAALYFEFDRKGGVLYWTKESDTNNPLTYIDRKGRAVIDTQRLPEAGDLWSFQSFDGKMLYVRTPEGGDNHTFHAYKARSLKHRGQKQLPCNAALRNTQGISIHTYSGAGSGLIVCDKKLKNEKWSSPPGPGDIMRLSKKVYFRRSYVHAGGIVTLTYTLFDKNGEIVTYTFTHPE